MTRRAFGTLCGLVFLINLGRVAFAPLVPTIGSEFGASPAVVGSVTTLVWVGSALPRIPVGYLLTRVPRHYVVLGSGIALSAAATFTGSAGSIRALQAGALSIGLASGAYFVAAVPLVAELFPSGRGRAIGIHGAASQLAAVIAPGVVVGILVVAGWNDVFRILATAAIAVTAVLFVVLRREPLPESAGADRDFRSALRHWRVILLVVVVVAAPGFVWQGVFNFYVTYLTGTKGLSTGLANTLLTVVFAAGLPAFWFGGQLADRLPQIPYLLGILVSFGGSILALVVVESAVMLVVATVAIGFVAHAMFPAADTFLLDSLPADNRASAYAVFSGIALLFESTGSGTLGVAAERIGFDAAFVAGGVGVLAVAAVLGALHVGRGLPGGRGTATE
ncbi:MFS transporter [Halorubrum cibi]|uniref:Predicted arabinose efflux permease, MFS family n=1 Tax=Halorubrum cibi TaxID=413815 RepID=A0A521C2C5_9EURY|nr:MFS transporter [Halorubrum cibi]SMO52961.1 Predicted arabinose efflux permease, MFS family [Halorubrum cibi]